MKIKIKKQIISSQKSNCKAKILDRVKMFASENSVESINDDLYDSGYAQACDDILERIQEEETNKGVMASEYLKRDL